MTHHRTAPFAILFSLCGLALGCTPVSFGNNNPDLECIPDWPESCIPEGTTGGEASETFSCDEDAADGKNRVYSCLPRAEDDSCPAVDSECVRDAFEKRYIVDCRECLLVAVEPACGPDPESSEACCYYLDLDYPDCDED